jgi:hypothetical protein
MKSAKNHPKTPGKPGTKVTVTGKSKATKLWGSMWNMVSSTYFTLMDIRTVNK